MYYKHVFEDSSCSFLLGPLVDLGVLFTLIPQFLLTKYGLIHCFVCYLSSRTIYVGANNSMFQRLGPAVLTCPISHLHCASIRDFAFHACRPWPLSGTSLPCHQLFAVSHSDSTTINTQPSSSTAYCIVDDCPRSRFLTCKNLSCPLLSLLRRIVLLSDVASYR